MPLSWNEIRLRASNFVNEWKEKAPTAREEADAQDFQTDFLNIFGVTRRQVATFEHRVRIGAEIDKLGGTKGGRRGYIDLFWKGRFMIEMKTPGKNRKDAFMQAKEYAENLSPKDLPQGILISDFLNFDYYDLEKGGELTSFSLADMPKMVELFSYLAGYKDVKFEAVDPVDIEAAEHMGELHDALKSNGYSGHQLEMYLVRLLFCLFADDSGIFDEKKVFYKYILEKTNEDGNDLAMHLGQIFDTLNEPKETRYKNIDETLNKFTYVNGQLFEERLKTAPFDSKTRKTLLKCCTLDWSQIKPEIFGAMFQSVKDKDKRRALGEHYTSETNILKVIRPLFLDELWEEFEKIRKQKSAKKRHELLQFHTNLRKLKFLDPACGCGNFLVVTYRELRLLEIEIISEIYQTQKVMDLKFLINVDVDQFYGIEIEEFPARIAQTALWLMDHIMNNKASAKFGDYFVRIPLETSPTIVIANALRKNGNEFDWETIVPKNELSYIMGNPPFLGARIMSQEQKADSKTVFKGMKESNNLDYVTCWYKKASEYIHGTNIEVAFVSTNSICQGEQVSILWPELINKHNIKINFAHQTFRWANEAKGKAAVYCVIIGFSQQERKKKNIYQYFTVDGEPMETTAKQINTYLLDAPQVFIQKRSKPICNVSEMVFGSMPNDGGFLLLSDNEKKELIKNEPFLDKVVRPFLGADEFINNVPRFCIWLKDVSPAIYQKSKIVVNRINEVRKHRENSTREATKKLADFPTIFGEIRQPETDYLLVPSTSSENRKYIPIGFIDKNTISSNANLLIPNATLYEFGVITSAIHMAWMRYVCGRLEMRYRYSASIVYNNFPWSTPTEKQKASIESAAQSVLDARNKFSDLSFATLYDNNLMPPILAKAHQKLDKAVEAVYGKVFSTDADRVSHLFYLYQTMTEGLFVGKSKKKRK